MVEEDEVGEVVRVVLVELLLVFDCWLSVVCVQVLLISVVIAIVVGAIVVVLSPLVAVVVQTVLVCNVDSRAVEGAPPLATELALFLLLVVVVVHVVVVVVVVVSVGVLFWLSVWCILFAFALFVFSWQLVLASVLVGMG